MSRSVNRASYSCPLCADANEPLKQIDDSDPRLYARCPNCDLIWLDSSQHLSKAAELSHYQQHQNDPNDPAYHAFLSRLWEPVKARLPKGATGLDFGSGPGPTLHLIAQADGFCCKHYDPFFQPDASVLQERYDFITCSETAEHFRRPAEAFEELTAILRPGAWLGVMTNRHTAQTDFASWPYRQDHTHVAFYSERSFAYIAEHFGFRSPEIISSTVILLQKEAI